MVNVRQGKTGRITERLVKQELEARGMSAVKPIPDRGIDLLVHYPGSERPALKIQVKGRGPTQTNGRYRWFQIRTTERQREKAAAKGIPPDRAWEDKVRLCDFFILVAQKYNEFWVLPQENILEIAEINKFKYGSRPDNRTGKQAELDLDILCRDRPLTELYAQHLNAFHLLMKELKHRKQT